MLCGEGISRALKAYLKLDKPPAYTVTPPVNGKPLEKLYVKSEVSLVQSNCIVRDD